MIDAGFPAHLSEVVPFKIKTEHLPIKPFEVLRKDHDLFTTDDKGHVGLAYEFNLRGIA